MQHVTLDLYNCNPQRLADGMFLQQVLEEYPQAIGMQQVSPAILQDIKTSNVLDDGFSGFVIIATSHVSLHAWPPYKMLNLDVFSCEPFSVQRVIDLACESFETRDIEVHVIKRATRSPRLAHSAMTH